MNEKRYMISDVARLVQVEPHTLRHWEEELGLAIPRNELRQRYYYDAELELFAFVRHMKEQGFQLKAIRVMLPAAAQLRQLDTDKLAALRERLDSVLLQEDAGNAEGRLHSTAEETQRESEQGEERLTSGRDERKRMEGQDKPKSAEGQDRRKPTTGQDRRKSTTGRRRVKHASVARQEREQAETVRQEPEGLRVVRPEQEQAETVRQEPEGLRVVKQEREQAETVRQEPEGLRVVRSEQEQAETVRQEPEGLRVVRSEQEQAETVRQEPELCLPDKQEASVFTDKTKVEQLRALMTGMMQDAMRENSRCLVEELTPAITLGVSSELRHMLLLQEEREEERFRRLDKVLREYQQGRQQAAVYREGGKKTKSKFFQKHKVRI